MQCCGRETCQIDVFINHLPAIWYPKDCHKLWRFALHRQNFPRPPVRHGSQTQRCYTLPSIYQRSSKTSNKQIKNILQNTVNKMGIGWKDKLPDALWSYRTVFMTPIGMSPYHIVYGKSCRLPVEQEHRAYWTIRNWIMDFDGAGEWRKMQLAELEEWREKVYHNSKIYTERTKRWHDKQIKIKKFKPRDKVLIFNSRVKLFGHGKLRSKWEGQFDIIDTSSHGAITLHDDSGNC